MVNSILIAGSTIVAIFMAITMNILRLKTASRPTSAKRIILPPIFMSTGSLMFLFPVFQITGLQVLEAIAVGAFFSILLIITTKFKVEEGHIYIVPSKMFMFILFGLLLLRLILKWIIGTKIDVGETSGMFYLLALGMILTWRLAMLIEYMNLKRKVLRRKTRM